MVIDRFHRLLRPKSKKSRKRSSESFDVVKIQRRSLSATYFYQKPQGAKSGGTLGSCAELEFPPLTLVGYGSRERQRASGRFFTVIYQRYGAIRPVLQNEKLPDDGYLAPGALPLTMVPFR